MGRTNLCRFLKRKEALLLPSAPGLTRRFGPVLLVVSQGSRRIAYAACAAARAAAAAGATATRGTAAAGAAATPATSGLAGTATSGPAGAAAAASATARARNGPAYFLEAYACDFTKVNKDNHQHQDNQSGQKSVLGCVLATLLAPQTPECSHHLNTLRRRSVPRSLADYNMYN